MPRYVAKEGGPFAEDFDQRLPDADGKPVFPDDFGDTIVAQALLTGPVRNRKLGSAAQPRRREVLQTLNITTGDVQFVPYRAKIHGTPPIELELAGTLARLADSSKLIKTLHKKTTRAHWGK